MILGATKGPRSLTRTFTCRLFWVLVTVRIVPKGRVRWAAVNWVESKISPEAVGRPSNSGPYQEAIPSCLNVTAPETWVWAAQNAVNIKLANTKPISAVVLFIPQLSVKTGLDITGASQISVLPWFDVRIAPFLYF
jgi:hypothetical protein